MILIKFVNSVHDNVTMILFFFAHEIQPKDANDFLF